MIHKAGVAIVSCIDNVWHALLVKQKLSGRWCFPKGSKLHMKESWQNCAKRELAEETGLFIDIQPTEKAVFVKDTAFFLYTAQKIDIIQFKTLKTKDPNEIESIEWRPIEISDKEKEDKVYHTSVEHILNHITNPDTDNLVIPPLKTIHPKKLRHMCYRSKWIPSTFFAKTNPSSSFKMKRCVKWR
jgi:8-oxo-dGTP pyrophosphatase MutT (NUDIX family)